METTTTIAEAPSTTRRLHVGTRDSCPVQNVHCGGQCLPRFTERVEANRETGETTRFRRQGDVLDLTTLQHDAMMRGINVRVVRWNQARSRGLILRTDDRRYVPAAGDEPLSKHLYVVPLPAGAQAPWETPAPLRGAEADELRVAETIARAEPDDAARRRDARARRADRAEPTGGGAA